MKCYGKEDIVLSEHVGDVEDNESGIVSIGHTVGMRCPIIFFNDGTKIVFDWQYLAEQAVKYRNSLI